MPILPSISTTEISQATLLGMSRQFDFFGGDIAWKSATNLTVEVMVYNVSSGESVISELSDLFVLRDGEDWSHIYVNGTYYGLGKLIGFSLPEGDFSQTAKCNLTFNIFNEGDDLTSLGGYYADYSAAFANKPFVDSLSENISLNVGENSISYSKQVDVKFNDSVSLQGSQDGPIQVAQDFAKKIFDADETNSYSTIPDLDSEQNIRDLLNANYKKIRSESINMITNECSFTETVEAQNVIGNYSHSATQSITINEQGIATVTEQGRVQGLTEPILPSAYTGYDTEIGNAKTRMQTLFSRLSDCGNLNEDAQGIMFVTSSKTIQEESGIIEYSVSADNDPRKENSLDNVIYERNIVVSKSNGYRQCTENGTIVGLSKIKYDAQEDSFDRYPKYQQAKSYYDGILSTILTRIKGELDLPSPEYTEKNESHALFQGQVSYSMTVSEDPTFSQNSTYKTFQTSSNKTYPSEKFYTFGILNEKTLVQDALNANAITQGNVSNNVTAILYRKDPSESAIASARNDLVTKAKSLFNASLETEDSDYPNSISYDFSYKNDVTISLNADYIMDLMEEASQ